MRRGVWCWAIWLVLSGLPALVAVAWVVSYVIGFGIEGRNITEQPSIITSGFTLETGRGRVGYLWWKDESEWDLQVQRDDHLWSGWKWVTYDIEYRSPPPWSKKDEWWNKLGFGFDWTASAPKGRYSTFSVAVPIWSILALTVLPGSVRFYRWRKVRQRETHGQCLGCGYDLRMSPDRCPECGRIAQTAATPGAQG